MSRRAALCRLSLTVALVTLVPTSAAGAKMPLARVAIDSRGVGAQTFRRNALLELQQQLVLRLAQEGFAVVAADRSPDVVIRLQVEEGAIRVVARAGGERREAVVKQADEDVDTFRLEATHRTIDLVRDLAHAWAPHIEQAPAAAACEQTAELTELDIAAGLGWEWRGQRDSSPELRLALRSGTADRVHLVAGATLGGWWSRDTTVFESKTTVGASWRLIEMDTGIAISLEIAGGVLHHIFHFEAGGESESGYRGDLMVASRLLAEWRAASAVSVAVWIEPTWTGRERQLLQGDRVVWHAEPYRVAGGLALAVEL